MKKIFLALFFAACNAGNGVHENGQNERPIDAGAGSDTCHPSDSGDSADVDSDSINSSDSIHDSGSVLPADSGSDVTNDSDSKTDTGLEYRPNPHWILRDNDGNALDAMVEPFGQGYLDDYDAGDCFFVRWFGSEFYGMFFSYETGRPENCKFYTANNDFIFLDSSCQGVAFSSVLTVDVVDGAMSYTKRNSLQTVFEYWVGQPDSCTHATIATGLNVYTFESISAEKIDILTNPPYILSLEF